LKDEIESRTNTLSPGKTISDHEIVLKIFSPFVFDLQVFLFVLLIFSFFLSFSEFSNIRKLILEHYIFNQLVDLPGYIMNLLPGQPDSLAEDIERLAKKYISRYLLPAQ
jgi:hypothetical protein